MTRLILFFTVLILSFTTLFARGTEDVNGIIKGNVTTNDDKPAAGVTILIKNSKKAAVTDDNGNFIIHNVASGRYEMEISLVGYAPISKTVIVENNGTINVSFQLKLSDAQLQEVIVTSVKNKFKSSTSDYANKMPLKSLENPQVYSSITKDLIKDQLVYSVDEALRNVAGMQKMWDATGRSGDGGAYYNLRGFYVQSTMRDGLASVITNTTDAANVEKVEVLKGPSATLYGSALSSYGGLINRVTKKPYDHFGGEVNVSGGSYDFFRASADINTPLDNNRKAMFRFNGAYNTQGSFQTTGKGYRYFAAPSLLFKPNDKLSIQLDAELTYGNSMPNQFVFLYFSGADLGFNSAANTGLDYKNSYVGDKLNTVSRSGNYFANMSYKISSHFTSSTNVSYSRSFSNGRNQYFFQVPNYMVTQNPADIGTPSVYLARADQTTEDSRNNIFQVQQYFNGDFKIGKFKNRAVFGLDYNNTDADQHFLSTYGYIDVVPTNVPGFDYSGFNGAAVQKFYDTANAAILQHYPVVSKTNIYSAFLSDVFNVTDRLELLAAVRLDHYNNKDIAYSTSYHQTTLSPKFGIVYQPIKDRISLFANYQNSFSNRGSYIAYDESSADSLVSKFAKPERANQWEVGVKTNLVNNKLTASLSYYNIKVDNILRTDDRDPARTQVQNGTQVSRGAELEIISNPFSGFTIFGGLSYNDSKYLNISDDLDGYRPNTAGSPWLANFWLSYRVQKNVLKGLHFGFGGNYANDNKIANSKSGGIFILPEYTVLNASIGYDYKKYSIAVKADNLTNKHYWQGFTTYNPQMLRQIVGSISYKF